MDYSHTTVDYVQPESVNVWSHPRDKRDCEQGRDVGPIENEVMDAIIHRFAVEDEWYAFTTHLESEETRVNVLEEIECEVTIND